MTALNDNRLVRTFDELRRDGRKTLIPFLTAGYPDMQTTAALLADIERRGVRICEIGVPYSDPVADGPTIQVSYTAALAAGVDSRRIFELVRGYRASGGKMALAAMVSYSIVFRHGVAEYFREARQAGFDAMIIPDLPLDEALSVEPLASAEGLANVMLIAPTTAPQRQLEIAAHSRGFVYYISVSGLTGERSTLPPETIEVVRTLRKHTDTPVCVGFGISRGETVKMVCQAADGAIVGSAIIHRITDGIDLPREQLVARIGDFVAELIAPLS